MPWRDILKKAMFVLCVFLALFTFLFPIFLYAHRDNEIADLLRKGDDAYKEKRYEESIGYSVEAYKFLRNTDDEPSFKAQVELRIGVTYYLLKKPDEAVPYLKKAYTTFNETHSTYDTLIAVHYIAASYLELGQSDKALTFLDEEASLLKEMNKNEELAKLLLFAGKIRIGKGDTAEALLNYEEALKIYRDHNLIGMTPSFLDAGTFLSSVGSDTYCAQFEFDKGLACLEGAIKIYRQINVSIYIARNLLKTGVVYGSQFVGQYDKALSYLHEALKIYQEYGDKKGVAECHRQLGRIYNKIGQYSKALNNHQEAYRINTSLNATGAMAVDLGGIGFTYYKMGQYEKALHYLHQAPTNFHTGLVYSSLGEYEKAITIFKNELRYRMDDPFVLMSLGLAYTLQKNYEEAEKVLLKVEEMRKKATGHKWKGVPYLVELYITTGRYDDALVYLVKMQPEWYADDPYRILFHTQLGLALKGKGSLKDASTEFLKAVTISEEMRTRLKDKEGFFSGGFAGSHIRPYKSLVATLSERALKGDDKDSQFLPYGRDLASSAFYFAESTKARRLLEEIAESSSQNDSTNLPDNLRQQEANILNQLLGVQEHWEEVYKKGNEKEFRVLIERKETLKKELDALINVIKIKYPRYAALRYPKPIPPEAIPLKENEILLEYVINDDATYLFKVRKGGLEKIYKIERGKEEIEKTVNEYALLLQNPSSPQEQLVKHGKQIYEILLEKPLKDVAANLNIIIIPDGILGLLPFESLVAEESPDGKRVAYISDRYKVTYFQSASILAFNRTLNPSIAQKSLFALGDPIYSIDDKRYVAIKRGLPFPGPSENIKDGKASFRALATRKEWGKTTGDDRDGKELEYPPLPETALEVKTIAGYFKTTLQPPDILLSLDANESSFRKVPLRNYRYLHFATHADLAGKVQGINEPFLLLGQVENNPEDNGFLTLTKVLNLSLDADLVVLSACLTGRGKTMEGEGVMNFSRAFQHAGARSIVSSLWEVASNETVEFMSIFYSKLKEGKMKAESLDFARNEMRKKYPHPYFWAPFVLYGEQ